MRTRRPFAVGTWRDIASSITASRWSLVRTCSSQSTSEFPHPTRLPAGQQCEPADELTEDQVEESERHDEDPRGPPPLMRDRRSTPWTRFSAPTGVLRVLPATENEHEGDTGSKH